MTAEIAIADLARVVHAHWRAQRLAEGWCEGAYDRAARTSPYLKPYGSFSHIELLREHWLTLGDVLGVARACDARLGALYIDAPRLLVGIAHLSRARDDAQAVLSAARSVHQSWRAVNAHLGLCNGDARALSAFDDLIAEDRAVTIANLRADMAAISVAVANLRGCVALLLEPAMTEHQALLAVLT